MDKSLKRILIIVTFAVVLFAAMMNFELVLNYVNKLTATILPVSIGLICAFILNVPMNGIEKIINRIFKKAKHRPQGTKLHLISLILTLLIVAAIIAALTTMVIPQMVKTVKSIVALIEEHWPSWVEFLDSKGINTDLLDRFAETLDLRALVDKVTSNVGILVGSIADVASATVSTVTSAVFGIIISIYVLLEKDKLAAQSEKLLRAYLKPKRAEFALHVGKLTKDNYARFLSGQCVEACILGGLILISFLIFKLPYAGLVAMVTAICALIPYIGALISCVLAVILALLVSPTKALICFVVYMVVQFVENQFIYPHVVGGSVGLSPLWTLVAVIIGGNLFGLVGMILFIPLVAVIGELLRDSVNRRIEAKDSKTPSQDA